MKLDYDFSMIELTAQEVREFADSIQLRARVFGKARMMYDETDRVVEIRNADTGELIDRYPNDAE